MGMDRKLVGKVPEKAGEETMQMWVSGFVLGPFFHEFLRFCTLGVYEPHIVHSVNQLGVANCRMELFGNGFLALQIRDEADSL